MSMVGADPQALRELAAQLRSGSQRLAAIVGELGGSLATHAWQGPDAHEFTQRWQTALRPSLMRVSEGLAAAASGLAAQAAQQDEASASSGGGGQGGGSAAGSHRVQDGKDVGGGGLKKLDGPVGRSDRELAGDNIRQGAIGDCWLVSSVGGVGSADPQFLRAHVKLNDDGSYTVTLYEKKGGFWPWDPARLEPVTVQVPGEVFADGVKGPDGQPSMASVYERAAAIHRGGTAADIDGGYVGEGLEMVTGRPATTVNDPSLQSIKDGLAEGRIYEVASERDHTWWPLDDEVDSPHVVPNHAYMVDAVETRDGELRIHVRNPWGPGFGDKYGDLWLTEQEFHDNFGDVASVGKG